MKHCNKCGSDKEAGDFHKRNASHDGLAAMCKTCQSAYDKGRANDAHRVSMRERYAKSDHGKVATAQAKRAYIQRNIDKRKAHVLVGNAVRDGKLSKEPCECCGSVMVQGHHDDYSKPFDVNWLCSKCHAWWHRLKRETSKEI